MKKLPLYTRKKLHEAKLKAAREQRALDREARPQEKWVRAQGRDIEKALKGVTSWK